MAKKRSTSAKAASKKPAKAMFPRSPLVTYDHNNPDLYLAAMKAMEAIIGRPTDLEGRLEWYAACLRHTLSSYFGGAHPFCELPASAPPEARDAFNALDSITLIQEALRRDQGRASQEMVLAIGWGIDLGTMIQRYAVQDLHGQAVAVGQALIEAKTAGNLTTSQRAKERSDLAHTEYTRLLSMQKNPAGMKTSTLKNMAKILGANGKPLYGTFATLVRYSKDWK